MIDSNRRTLSPRWLELIEEGQRDGSIHTEYAKELSELMVLFDLWLIPSVFPGDKGAIHSRFMCMMEILEKMGLPLYEKELEEKFMSLTYFSGTE